VKPGPTSADGQPLAARGIQTRRRLLDAVATAVEQEGLRGLRLADVAAEVGISAPAFYQYFNDLDEAILALCEEVGQMLPPFKAGGDDGDGVSESTREFVARFFEYWDEHRAVLWTRNVAVTSDDPRFADVRNEAFVPMLDAVRARIEAGQRVGAVDPQVSATSLGAVLTVMLDRIAMLTPILLGSRENETQDDLVGAVAYLFDRALGVGGAPAKGRRPAARGRAKQA
jgi:AcrR family transcriptional regulator